MRVLNYHVPCGCEARKEIMFEKGNLGIPEAALVAFSLGLVLIAWRVGK